MISAEEYLKSLDEKSVWVFTKQQTSNLEQIINATNFNTKRVSTMENMFQFY